MNSSTRTLVATGIGVVFVGSLVGFWFTSGGAGVPGNSKPAATDLTDNASQADFLVTGEAKEQLETLCSKLQNPGDIAASIEQIRALTAQQVADESPAASGTMVVVSECVANHFEKLDSQAQRFALRYLSEVLVWHSENSSPLWVSLLEPCATLVAKAIESNDSAVRVVGLQFSQGFWSWKPQAIDDDGETSLSHSRNQVCKVVLPLLDTLNQQVRAAAASSIATYPDERIAAKSLELLDRPSTVVVRSLLLTLAERADVLASDEVIRFLAHESSEVRRTAELVLRGRGLTQEEIAMASRAHHPSPLVRSQVPSHVLQSGVVDQLVWLMFLSEDEDSTVRTEAARALVTLDSEDARFRLEQMAKEDEDAAVRELVQNLLTPTDKALNLPALRAPAAN